MKGVLPCSRTLLVNQVERLWASVTGGSKPSVIILLSTAIQGTVTAYDTEIFEWETLLAVG